MLNNPDMHVRVPVYPLPQEFITVVRAHPMYEKVMRP